MGVVAAVIGSGAAGYLLPQFFPSKPTEEVKSGLTPYIFVWQRNVNNAPPPDSLFNVYRGYADAMAGDEFYFVPSVNPSAADSVTSWGRLNKFIPSSARTIPLIETKEILSENNMVGSDGLIHVDNPDVKDTIINSISGLAETPPLQ